MFYDANLMNSQSIGKAWRAANNLVVGDEAEKDLSKICNKIDRWVGSDSEAVKGRMSLRASSTLVGGVSKIYKAGVERLYNDVTKLDGGILRRKRLCSSSTGSCSSNTNSDQEDTPEEMIGHTPVQTASSLTPRKKGKTMSASPKMVAIEHNMERSADDPSIHRRLSKGNSRDGITCSLGSENIDPVNKEVRSNVLEPSDTEETHPETRDQSTQTSPTSPRAVNISPEDDFDPNLPFGYVVIHDNQSSGIPSRIILSSINKNIKNLI